MEYLIGVVLSVVIISAVIAVGIGRDRSFYATMMIVIASYYILFAVLGGSGHAIILETAIALGFMVAAVMGFRKSLWLVVAALVGHGLLDSVHHQLIANPGVPAWWPGFCMAFDIVAGGLLAYLLMTRHRFSLQARGGRAPAGAR